ncbi:MAG TPA: RdgB/HAM1 family non-canonical purine NTP pyrophosphatase [Syntrophorhabdales bacterium]|nr:RdgB/HAM1 family non-canonical purine NTP pyrophosphatase [Syntrophorhabdales bacterium]
MHDLIVATTNQGKFREIKEVLAGQFTSFYSLLDFKGGYTVDEDQPSYAENAWKKARKIGSRFGIDTLADDSGLEVDALGGRPGIYSSRYGTTDKERIDRLLAELEGIEKKNRGAIFKAYLAFYMPGEGRGYFFYGSLRGHIGFERRGQGGFGFDPVFCLPELGKYMAELTVEEKNRISHRGKALAAFSNFLQRELQTPLYQ